MRPILIAVLMTTHNRVTTARRSLVHLARAVDKSGASAVVFISNSGSDTLFDQNFSAPENITVQENLVSGDSFWADSMRISWLSYEKFRSDFNFVLWLNDDTFLFDDSISRLISARESIGHPCVLVGSTSSKSGVLSYGGLDSLNWILPLHFKPAPPSAEVRLCDTFNGNIIMIDAHLDRRVGGFPSGFTHLRADLAFGLECKRKSIETYVSPGFYGLCEPNAEYTKYGELRGLSFREKLRKLNGPKFGPISEIFLFSLKYGGILGPLYAFTPIARSLLAR